MSKLESPGSERNISPEGKIKTTQKEQEKHEQMKQRKRILEQQRIEEALKKTERGAEELLKLSPGERAKKLKEIEEEVEK